jgi:hypothetical protein
MDHALVHKGRKMALTRCEMPGQEYGGTGWFRPVTMGTRRRYPVTE